MNAAAQRYPAPLSNPDNSPEAQEKFCALLADLKEDEAFIRKAEQVIWLSAYAANNPRSCFHWQADACSDEAERRGKPELYKTAYDKARGSML